MCSYTLWRLLDGRRSYEMEPEMDKPDFPPLSMSYPHIDVVSLFCFAFFRVHACVGRGRKKLILHELLVVHRKSADCEEPAW